MLNLKIVVAAAFSIGLTASSVAAKEPAQENYAFWAKTGFQTYSCVTDSSGGQTRPCPSDFKPGDRAIDRFAQQFDKSTGRLPGAVTLVEADGKVLQATCWIGNESCVFVGDAFSIDKTPVGPVAMFQFGAQSSVSSIVALKSDGTGEFRMETDTYEGANGGYYMYKFKTTLGYRSYTFVPEGDWQ